MNINDFKHYQIKICIIGAKKTPVKTEDIYIQSLPDKLKVLGEGDSITFETINDHLITLNLSDVRIEFGDVSIESEYENIEIGEDRMCIKLAKGTINLLPITRCETDTWCLYKRK